MLARRGATIHPRSPRAMLSLSTRSLLRAMTAASLLALSFWAGIGDSTALAAYSSSPVPDNSPLEEEEDDANLAREHRPVIARQRPAAKSAHGQTDASTGSSALVKREDASNCRTSATALENFNGLGAPLRL